MILSKFRNLRPGGPDAVHYNAFWPAWQVFPSISDEIRGQPRPVTENCRDMGVKLREFDGFLFHGPVLNFIGLKLESREDGL